jgi:hypothetical protein
VGRRYALEAATAQELPFLLERQVVANLRRTMEDYLRFTLMLANDGEFSRQETCRKEDCGIHDG